MQRPNTHKKSFPYIAQKQERIARKKERARERLPKNPFVPKKRRFEERNRNLKERKLGSKGFLQTLPTQIERKFSMSHASPIRHTQVLEHAAFWLFMLLFIFDYHFLEHNWASAFGAAFLEILSYAAIIYLNLWGLIPLFLEKKKTFRYVLSLAAVVLGYVFLMRYTGWETEFYEIGGWRNIFSMVLNTSLFLLISSLYWFFKQGQQARERNFLLTTEKLEAELSFLRTQISPHFVFNTLNNIYTLSLQKHENTAPMVAKLSALLRHILYESNRGEVLLEKELDTLRQYLELNLLRKPRSQNVDFYIEGSPGAWRIAPMLLINFAENAFKHSNLDHDELAWIKINAEIGETGELYFLLENSIAPAGTQPEPGGIGLQNARRQLELQYPGQHTLIFQEIDGTFRVNLHLQLKKA